MVTLSGLFAPVIFFAVGLGGLAVLDPRFTTFRYISHWPWELWAVAVFGAVATAGGVADWLFHRTFVTVGRAEHRSHVLALLTGGVPLFILMAAATLTPWRGELLLPILAVVLYTTVLICYDEFAFHSHRCRPIETLYHRLLTIGNCCAWLAWLHWIFVRGGTGA